MDYLSQCYIEFVKYSPNGEVEPAASAQTGSLMWIILALLVAVLAISSIVVLHSIKSKANTSSTGNISVVKNKILPLLLLVFVIFFAFIAVQIATGTNIQANATGVNATNIQVQVNEETGELIFNDAKLVNDTGENIMSKTVSMKYLESGLENASWDISFDGNSVFSGTVPGTNAKEIPLNKETTIHASASKVNGDVAKSLTGKKVAVIDIVTQKEGAQETYEIAPAPRNIVYDRGKFSLAEKIAIAADKSIDQVTINYLDEVLNNHGVIHEAFNEASVKNNSIELTTDPTLTNIDQHKISITPEKIIITGKNTTAAYLGVTTLKSILDKVSDKKVQCLRIEDFAQTGWRGFIEGYYGIPWSTENRLDLMEYGRNFKMNSYIYAPKDDPYHSQQWRDPYPQKELEGMKKLVDAGIRYKMDFSWAIHPLLHNAFDFNNYDSDLALVISKFEQLYGIGVRHFGLSADDISADHPVSPENQLKLLADLDKWCKSKPDVKNLIFVPECYNYGRSLPHERFYEYWNVLKQAPQSVDMMWTGHNIMNEASQETFDFFEQISGHKAFMWLNYPVNDYCQNHLLMGKAEFLIPGTKGFIGLVSNPMQQAQASKVALYSTACYVWNTDNFDQQAVVDKAYKFVDSGASESLKLICKHLCYSKYVKDMLNMNFEESTYMKQDLEDASSLLDDDKALDKSLRDRLYTKYAEIERALDDFEKNHTNAGLYEEMNPWLNALHNLCHANKNAFDAFENLEKGDKEAARASLEAAKADFATSKTFEVPVLPGKEKVYAEAGGKRLVPLTQQMLAYLENHIK